MDFILKLSLIIIALAVNKVVSDSTIELNCSSDHDCNSFADEHIAVKCFGICECFYKENGTETTCMPRKSKVYNEISSCPCRVVNTECKNDKCVCKESFIKSEDKLKCLTKIVQLGKSCDVPAQCQRFERNSECKENVCRCKEDFIEINNSTCRSKATQEENSTCDNQEKKCGLNQECIKNQCVCNENFIYGLNKTECIEYSNYDDNCIDHAQCEMGIGNGTMCENNKCTCDKNHSKTTLNGKHICQRHVHHMQECQKDTDCAKYFDDSRMWCVNNKCVCSEGYHLSDGFHENCVPDENKSSSAKSIYSSSLVIIIVTLLLSIY